MIQRKSSLVFLRMPYRIVPLPTKGLYFNIPCKKLDYVDCLVNSELFLRDICNLDILSKDDLLDTKDLRFIFDGTLYEQIDDVTMTSGRLKYRPFHRRRYVDDIFVLFNSPEDLKRIHVYSNARHMKQSFVLENENDRRTFLLDVNVIREQGKFTASVYRRPTFGRIYTHFDSFLPSTYKTGMILTLL